MRAPLRTVSDRLLLVAGLLPLAAVAQVPVDAAAATPPRRTAIAVQQDFVAIAKRVFPGVVTVRTFVRGDAAPTLASGPAATPAATTEPGGWVAAPTTERDYPGFRPHGSGSGFFVGDSCEVLTCLQPLRVAGEKLVDLIEIETYDGHRVLCDLVGSEPTLQLAVLRAAVFPGWAKPEMRGISFGDSEAAEIGSWLLGFGDPLGPERFLGAGLLVAKPSRDCYQELMTATYMQSTMLVPDGALGGPLVDLDGNVVGILARLDVATAGVAYPTGSAWALPSKILQGLYESIRVAGTTQSPWLGFSVLGRTEIATTRGLPAFQKMVKPSHGILLENVFAPSPATVAGLAPDDFLTHFGGVEIHAPVDFQRQLYLAGVGRKVTLRFFRAGDVFEKELVIERRPAAATPR